MLEKAQPEAQAGGVERAKRTNTSVRTGARFERRREAIVAAAIPILNGEGFKGMRLTAVAELIGLRATGITYYFPRKEDLAVACMEAGFSAFHELLSDAEQAADVPGRIARLIDLFVQREVAVHRGERPPLASFSSLRSLEGDHFHRLFDGYKVMFRRVRALFESPELPTLDQNGRTIRTHILLEQLYWAHAWLAECDPEDFPRATARMTDIIVNGIATPDSDIDVAEIDISGEFAGTDASKENFFCAATRQINMHGYRGASVDRIAASLNRTKGAFYHHNDAKDELVAECFRRNFDVMREARRAAQDAESCDWRRLVASVKAVLRFQVSEQGPMLRTAVLHSLPQQHQNEIVGRLRKIEAAIAGMIGDAAAIGAARPVDATIAAHFLVGALNAASELRDWRRLSPEQATPAYCRALFFGLASP